MIFLRFAATIRFAAFRIMYGFLLSGDEIYLLAAIQNCTVIEISRSAIQILSLLNIVGSEEFVSHFM